MKIIYTFLMVLILSGCKTIENKSQKAIKEENKKLSIFLQKPESELKIVLGQPDKIIQDEAGSQFFIYIKKKYNITCERKFEIDNSNTVIGFTSKGCF